MLGIALADDASDSIALDDFAMLADRLDAATDFHGSSDEPEETNQEKFGAKICRISGLGPFCNPGP